MPIYNGNYVAPVWVNNQPPAINETELLAMSQTIQASQILHGSGAPTQYTSGIAGQRYADTSTTPPTIYKLKAAAEDANVWELDDSEGNIALDYSSSATYSEGDYCIYAGALYKAAQDISTAESWTAAHWQRALVADDLADHVANQSNPHEVTAPQTGALPTEKIAFIEPGWKAENRVYYPGDCVVLFPHTSPSLHIVTQFIGYDEYFSINNNVTPAVILTDVKANKDMFATVEGVQASKAYAVDDYLVKGGALYKVTQPIAQYGGIYTFGEQTNVVAVKLADEVAGLSGVINKPPRINSSGYWEVWDQNTNAYVSTGYSVVVNPPMVANTASEMTNHGQVYIYNGNESGYQHGYWYYWNGSAWTAGAAYQVAATDKTLTVADAAADAKATGDAVGELKSALTKDEKIAGLDWRFGFIKADGNFSSGGTDRLASRFIPCPPNTSITYVAETNHDNVCGIAFYNKNTTFISGEKNNGALGTPVTVTSPAGTVYLRLSTKVSIKDITYLEFTGNNTQALAWLQRQISDITVYVDGTNGNDTSGIGTTGSPYKTIGRAIQQGGRNICIKPGTYQEKVSASFLEYLHLFADKATWTSGTPDRPKVIIDGNNAIDTPLDLSYIRELYIEDIVVQYSASGKKGCVITDCNHLEMQNCEFHHNGHDGCVINYTNGLIRDCKASYNGNDGFNMNYYGDTQFYNCSGHDNVDDGISHHQGTTGSINGGEWYNNGKGGVASPAHGSQVDIYNVYCHDNGYGIYANADSDTTARTFHVWNSVLVNNTHYGITSKRNTAIMYNCKITGNTDGQTTAPQGGQIITL